MSAAQDGGPATTPTPADTKTVTTIPGLLAARGELVLYLHSRNPNIDERKTIDAIFEKHIAVHIREVQAVHAKLTEDNDRLERALSAATAESQRLSDENNKYALNLAEATRGLEWQPAVVALHAEVERLKAQLQLANLSTADKAATCPHCRGEIGVILTTVADQGAIRTQLTQANEQADTFQADFQRTDAELALAKADLFRANERAEIMQRTCDSQESAYRAAMKHGDNLKARLTSLASDLRATLVVAQQDYSHLLGGKRTIAALTTLLTRLESPNTKTI